MCGAQPLLSHLLLTYFLHDTLHGLGELSKRLLGQVLHSLLVLFSYGLEGLEHL
jgi:hypothetical protein